MYEAIQSVHRPVCKFNPWIVDVIASGPEYIHMLQLTKSDVLYKKHIHIHAHRKVE